MIYLKLFLTFLKIGLFTFGGGYGMISLIREECLSNCWLTESELLNFIAVAESTPGPIAVNMATFVGSAQGGLAGALVATAGVVLPSFVIILAIAAALKNILKFGGVKAALEGVRPAIVGLITATAVVMLLGTVFGIEKADGFFAFDYKSLIVLGVLASVFALYKRIRKKNISPVLLIILSGILGVILF